MAPMMIATSRPKSVSSRLRIMRLWSLMICCSLIIVLGAHLHRAAAAAADAASAARTSDDVEEDGLHGTESSSPAAGGGGGDGGRDSDSNFEYSGIGINCTIAPPPGSYQPSPIPPNDAQLLEVALNLEYLEAELFLNGAYGSGLEAFDPSLIAGGPRPIGAQKANLDPFILDITKQLALQEVGHIRAIKRSIPNAFPRVQLDISVGVFARTMNAALGHTLSPPFNPYANSLNWLLAIYLVPYVGLTGYVGANPSLSSSTAKRLVAGLLAVESGQDAQIRTLLYERKEARVYGLTVGEITDRLSELRNALGHTGTVDEGLVVPPCLGAEGKISGNTLAGDAYSLGYGRTPAQIFSIVYGTGSASQPGGFFPKGANGSIARSLLASGHSP